MGINSDVLVAIITISVIGLSLGISVIKHNRDNKKNKK
jgi:hypothetical protein